MRLGVAVDLGHAGMRTTAEAIAKSKTPALITHTGCRAVHEHPRNQTDENLRALADRGGVVGIYFMPYLVASPTVPTAEHVVDASRARARRRRDGARRHRYGWRDRRLRDER